MRSSLIGGIMMLATVVAQGQDSAARKKLTLREAIDIAMRNNITIRQTGLDVENSKALWQQSRAQLLPAVNGNFNYGWNQGRSIDPFTNIYSTNDIVGSSGSLNGSLNLFSGLSVRNGIKQSAYSYEASRLDLQQQKDNTTLDVINAYLLALNNEDLYSASRNQAAVTRAQVERMDILVREGAKGLADLTQLKGQLNTNDISVVNALNNMRTAKVRLCQLLNIAIEPALPLSRAEIESPVEIYPLSSQQVVEAAFSNLAAVKSADLKVKSAEKGVDFQKGFYYPQLSLVGSVGSNYSSLATTQERTGSRIDTTGFYVPSNGQQLPVLVTQDEYKSSKISYGSQFRNNVTSYYGFQLYIPLFSNLQTRTRVRQAEISYKRARNEAENTRLQLKQNIEIAYQNMQASFDRYKAYIEQVENYKESFRASEIKFNEGAILPTEYIIAKNNLDQANLDLITTRYDYIFRTRILDYYQGKIAF